MSDFIMSLSDTSAGLSQVGGKGASLARLVAAGLLVPPGFHITTTAYRRFVADHGLQKQILATVAFATPSQPATLEEASSRIIQLFIEHSMADDMAEEIRRAYAELGEGDVPVAVRSSATAEDLPEASFAGQQETYLNIHGIDEVLDAVKNYGYVYVGMKSKYILKMIVATITYTKKMLQNSRERWAAVRARSREVATKWQINDLTTLSAPNLMTGVREIFGATAEYYTVAQSGQIPAALSSEVTFGRFYNMLVKRKDDPAFTTFLLGIENLPLRAEKSLYDLAMWVGEQAELVDYIKQAPSESICSALQADFVPAPLSGGFSDRFAAHLAEFGHTLYDLDFAKSVPADAPLPLVEALKAYLEGKGVNPHERQKNQMERREQAEQVITKRLGTPRRKWFLKLLNWAKDNAPDREDCIADMGLGYPQLR